MKESPNRIITMGGSAGGLEAMRDILSLINADLHISVFLVLHSGNIPTPAMRSKVSAASPFPADFPIDGEAINPQRVYLAPPDHHMLIKNNNIRTDRV